MPNSRDGLRSGPERMDRIGVCHLVSGDLWAGAEVVVGNLLRGLTAFPELRLSAVCLNDGRLASEIRKLSIPVYVISEKKRSFLGLMAGVKQALNQERPQILHSHRYKENILAHCSSYRNPRIRRITTQHGMPESSPTELGLSRLLVLRYNAALLARVFHAVVAVSHEMQRTLRDRSHVPASKSVVIHNGIEVPDGPPRGTHGGLVIGSSGRFVPIKDYPLMIQIAGELVKARHAIRFELAGDGPESDRLKRLISRSRLDQTFSLRGFLDETGPFYDGLDLYICTSRHEGIPMSVLEAMSHRLPVVASRVGGLGEIIDDGVQGYLVDRRDLDGFVQKCLLLCRDDALRERMGNSARERVVERFSLATMASKYRDLYCEVAG